MKAKHTPGPWQLLPEERDKPYIRIRGTVLGGRYKVANVLTLVYDGAPECEAEETRANARLIAAAPELLEALCVMVNFSESPDFDGAPSDSAVIKARAAIAKATENQS